MSPFPFRKKVVVPWYGKLFAVVAILIAFIQSEKRAPLVTREIVDQVLYRLAQLLGRYLKK